MAKPIAAVSINAGKGVFVILDDGQCFFLAKPRDKEWKPAAAIPGTPAATPKKPAAPSQITPSTSFKSLR